MLNIFFKNTFDSLNIKIDDNELLNEMIYFTYGVPLLMQQIGDGVFWSIENNVVDENSVYEGIKKAAFELRLKLLKNLNEIKNPHYNNILIKLAENNKINFNRDELSSLLTDNENKVLNEFICEMIDLNIIQYIKNDEFEFINPAYFVYFLINSTFKNLI